MGFALGGGIGCIDLDHCLAGGRLTSFAAEVLAACPATYVEVSPSGSGLHIFGLIPEGPGFKRAGIEAYSVGRYMTVTARPFEGSAPVLGDLRGVVELFARYSR